MTPISSIFIRVANISYSEKNNSCANPSLSLPVEPYCKFFIIVFISDPHFNIDLPVAVC